MDLLIRFLIGGLVVSAFAVLGDIFRPKSFAGLFGAAPSVALATLALTIAKDGVGYAATEARSMMVGAVALGLYCQLNSYLIMRFKWPTLAVTTFSIFLWFAVAFGLRFLFLH
jgi:uncharacterized membrane protein (GlpM family)